MSLYRDILEAKAGGRKLLAILLDPDKFDWQKQTLAASKINSSPATHLLVGGSSVASGETQKLVEFLKEHCRLPVVLFPGDPSQISDSADAILFLSLLSGRNPDFLIGHHVNAAAILKKSSLEIIPTGYILIESGSETAVARVSKTAPLPFSDIEIIVNTAIAGEMLGSKLIYLEAGSGAKNCVPPAVIKAVRENLTIPLIVGGGIRSRSGISQAFQSGADLVVIGTAFESDPEFFQK